MYLIVGLGNPGRKFENTKHNAGFMVLDAYAKRHGLAFDGEKFDALIAKGVIEGKKALLIKPQTFMNLSGDAVEKFVNYYDVDLSELIIVHDDVEFEQGIIKIRAKGSGGTHNGMRDIVKKLGSGEFPRLRFGVGQNKEMELYEYVLSPFTFLQMEEKINPSVERACDILDCILSEGIDMAMNKYNPRKEKKKQEEEEES